VAEAAASRRRLRPEAVALLGPGIAWLFLFYVVPLAIIFLVSLGQRDPATPQRIQTVWGRGYKLVDTDGDAA